MEHPASVRWRATINTPSSMRTSRPITFLGRAALLGLLAPSAACGPATNQLRSQPSTEHEQPCLEREQADYEDEEGAGESTAEEALSALPADERPSGQPRVNDDAKRDDRVEWTYFDGDAERGSVVAELNPWGLWTATQVTRCAD